MGGSFASDGTCVPSLALIGARLSQVVESEETEVLGKRLSQVVGSEEKCLSPPQ